MAAEPQTAEAVGPEYRELAAFFDDFAAEEAEWRRRNRAYHGWIAKLHRFQIPPGARVLEIGCGSGDLLAALEPSVGVGIDVSPRLVELARSRHPDLRFETGAGERLDLSETFDYVVLSDVLPFVHDLVALFDRVAAHCHPGTRVVVHSYSRMWRPIIRMAELAGQKPRKPIRNWIAPEVIKNLLQLSDFEVVTEARRMLLPKRVPLLNLAFNGVVGSIWPFSHLCLTYWVVARPRTQPREELSVSIVCPCRNERGNVAEVVRRLPELGTATELVFVEGGSKDGTRAEIERVIAEHPEKDIDLVAQPGAGKGTRFGRGSKPRPTTSSESSTGT